ncbi:signal peptidase I [Sutcliffiella horikoshii]|uniref:Signal peptidase I n=1 Tax=Sutcliffiella horikoshii TaxID=79883 RepID=A0A5D4TBK9_9BACI|nr:signal peptidase I [Sutcliffiella horikoshii]TYS72281.1 signal peptidase I [Sutcliffiella horikoshii]
MLIKIGKWSFYSLLSLLLVLVVFSALLGFQAKSNPNQIPSIAGISPLTILSDSMQPVFQAGDMIFSKAIAADEVMVDDIITFKQDNIIVTHRVIEVVEEQDQTFFKTKGDNVTIADDTLLASENVIAKQLFTIPKLGHLTQFASTSLGMILIFGVPFLLYVAVEIYDRFIRRNQTQQAA